ncbi:hypothetical protein CC78DRAFT_180242 [Lojkania enalia]|uniref:Uncharacterized protein n=1 Tax=Lojkania enalia TaxID=147567 RepID=A0A9P4KD30_9PLEO|nr:hypothetical protein CC78DRAFT_180242 [Didymosphaeria enalia]
MLVLEPSQNPAAWRVGSYRPWLPVFESYTPQSSSWDALTWRFHRSHPHATPARSLWCGSKCITIPDQCPFDLVIIRNHEPTVSSCLLRYCTHALRRMCSRNLDSNPPDGGSHPVPIYTNENAHVEAGSYGWEEGHWLSNRNACFWPILLRYSDVQS